MDHDKPNTRICIVDDDPSVRRALSRLVESMGMRVSAFASPLGLLQSGPMTEFDCLLLDVHLPGMDGFELHNRVVAAGHEIPVIFISAHTDDRTRGRAKAAGATACLSKPFEDQALLDAIRTAIETSAGSRNDRF